MDDNIRDKEFLGRGLAFPLQLDPRGGISLASGENEIMQAIKIILETRPGERVMRPEFGCRIHELVFAPNNASTKALAMHYVKQALDRWEPRIDVTEVAILDEVDRNEVMFIEIKYQTKDAHEERSIVYPFYLTDEEEEL